MLAPQQHHISRPNDPVTPTNSVLQPINHLKTMIVPLTVQSITPDHNQSSMEFPSSQELAKRQNPTDRLKRSRERNRMHARKTRQRKKEHMQLLQKRAEDLKSEQISLKQIINEKNTASILVGMFATSKNNSAETNSANAMVDELLKRPSDEIPDVSRIAELPALILPGQHSKRRLSKEGEDTEGPPIPLDQYPNDGIDYKLLGKDRSKCTPAELDKIRKERNRMHAKRTRDRKRIFMEEMEDIIRQLENENKFLEDHLKIMAAQEMDATATDNSLPHKAPTTAPTTTTTTTTTQIIKQEENLTTPTQPVTAQTLTYITETGNSNGVQCLLTLATASVEKRSYDRMSTTSSNTSLSSGPSGQVSTQSDDYHSTYSEPSKTGNTSYPPPKKFCLKKYSLQSSHLPSSITTIQQ